MRRRTLPRFLATLFGVSAVFASTLTAQNRIVAQATSASSRASISNTVVPRARQATDLGTVPADTQLSSVTLRFNLTDVQNAALTQLLSDQQNPASALYHQWLTPEQFAAQFGLSSADIASVSSFLQSQGLTVTSVSRGHTSITVSGTAAQVGKALAVSLHWVSLNGEKHFTNLVDPTLPAGIASVVGGITGLNDFRLKPHVRSHVVTDPKFTSATSGNHYVAPGDFYTIYDVNPLLTNSINGTGITIAVMGQTDISLSDVSAFRSASGLSTTNLPTIKLVTTDPGTSSTDIDEAQLDVEWSGAVAPSATILYINSTDVIGSSLTYAIDNNVAPLITISYGDCESGFGASAIATYNQLFRQANAQGQTILGPAGDSGAADCDYEATTAVGGLAVDFPASSPSVTGLGGSMFNEGTGTYWNASNGSYSGSALSYIPEAVWNETASYGSLAAGGGGASLFFTKPAFQVGTGVPEDSSRDVPDLALNAAAEHDGYLFCSQGFCTNGYRDASGYLDVVGGTSVATPSFAGIMALLEQKIQTRVGNANPTIYGLANSATYYTSVFHDITTGNNAVPCTAGTPNCPSGGTIGFNATAGYDQASGWGSVDAYNMVADWLLVTPTGLTSTTGSTSSSVSVNATPRSVVAGASITVSATVASVSASSSTPSGTVQFLVDNVATGSPVSLTGGSASYTLATSALTSGAHTVTAAYSGDTTFNGSKAAVNIDIISAAAPDFSLSPATASVTVAPGQNASGITFTVTPTNGFVGSVAFSASTTALTLNASYSYSVTPVVITSTAAGSTVLTLSAYVAEDKTSTAFNKPVVLAAVRHPDKAGTPAWKFAGSGVAFAGLLCLLVPARRKRWTGLIAAVLTIGALSLSGCSESSIGHNTGTTVTGTQVNTTAGTYNILVTATGLNAAGTRVTHNATVTFVVN